MMMKPVSIVVIIVVIVVVIKVVIVVGYYSGFTLGYTGLIQQCLQMNTKNFSIGLIINNYNRYRLGKYKFVLLTFNKCKDKIMLLNLVT